MSVVFVHQVSDTKADVFAIGTKRIVRKPKKGEKDFGEAGTDWTRFSPVVDIEPLDDLAFDEENIELNAFSREMQNKILDYINGLASVSSYAVDLLQNLPISNFHQQISYWVGEKVYLYRKEGQDLLETVNIIDRFKKSMHILYKEHEIAKYNKEIRNQFTDYYALIRHSRQHLQNQQVIKQNPTGQAGTGNQQGGAPIPSSRQKNIDNLEQKIAERLKEITLPAEVDKIVQEDLERIRLIEPSSPEYNVTRNYILSLIKIPWGVLTADNLDLQRSESVLNQHHYGLKTVKERILQFISIGIIKNSLNKASAGKIICLVGPPGVGKTRLVFPFSLFIFFPLPFSFPLFLFLLFLFPSSSSHFFPFSPFSSPFPLPLPFSSPFCLSLLPTSPFPSEDRSGNSFKDTSHSLTPSTTLPSLACGILLINSLPF